MDADPCAFVYFVSFFAAAADFFAGLAGRLLPKEPLNIFPFLVFLSPLPMICFFLNSIKSPDTHARMAGNGALSPVCVQHYNFADSSLPALNLATFLALILITAPV